MGTAEACATVLQHLLFALRLCLRCTLNAVQHRQDALRDMINPVHGYVSLPLCALSSEHKVSLFWCFFSLFPPPHSISLPLSRPNTEPLSTVPCPLLLPSSLLLQLLLLPLPHCHGTRCFNLCVPLPLGHLHIHSHISLAYLSSSFSFSCFSYCPFSSFPPFLLFSLLPMTPLLLLSPPLPCSLFQKEGLSHSKQRVC